MAHQTSNTDNNPAGTSIENLMQLLQLLTTIQQLEAPQRARDKETRQRESTLENLKLSLGARAPAKVDTPGLVQGQTIFGRASNRKALLLQDVDPEDTEEIAKLTKRAELQNQADAKLLANLSQFLADKGDIAGAKFAFRASETLVPPDAETIERRKLVARKRTAATKKRQTGGFSVTGGPRSGFAARGTPAEILAQLIATRPAELQAKFGGFTDVGKHETPPKKEDKKKKAKRKQTFRISQTGPGASQGTPRVPEGIKTSRGGGRAPSTSDAAIERILERSRRKKRKSSATDDLLAILLGA